jgi:PBSX family phage terminase large subunit
VVLLARKRSKESIEAEELYKRGVSLVDIANKINKPPGTVRRWKSTQNWDNDKSERSGSKANVRNEKKNSNNSKKEVVADEVKMVVENPELTDKQRLFCCLYIKCFNATKAYQKAYGCSYQVACGHGHALLKSVEIKQEILRLKQERLNREFLSESDIFQKYMDIAFADITDYATFGNKDVVVDGEERTYSFVDIKDSNTVDGTLISEISQGRDGVKVKLLDKMKALDWIAAHMDMGTEEQRAKVQKLQMEISAMEKESDYEDEVEYKGIPSNMIAPAFAPVVFDIAEQSHTEYVFPGGRGSTKSSFISLEIIDLIKSNEEMHAVVMRQVADTLRGSVYQQILWAIDALGLSDEFHATVSPMEITRKPTGQKIYFRGADDPGKVKSIKVPFGYIGILWLEELDQFVGPESVRKIEQSVIRGGDTAFIFKSFNPPKSATNWANKYIKIPKESRIVTYSTYLDVPKRWLGRPFLEEAQFLKEINPTAYENEYLGVANGVGGSVFDNVTVKEITDKEIAQFDRIYNGADWGWYPDPYHFVRLHHDAARMKLYIFMEYRCNKKSNRQTADKLIEMGITSNDLITCDSAENKSVGDYKSYGLFARGAEKGPGSVEYSMKWLQSLTEIVIDNSRCPETATEFLDYEYERDKEGNVISGYPDKDNHAIDAVRYATNPIWKKRGQ